VRFISRAGQDMFLRRATVLLAAFYILLPLARLY